MSKRRPLSDSDSDSSVMTPRESSPERDDGPMTYSQAVRLARKARATVATRKDLNSPRCTPEYYLQEDRRARATKCAPVNNDNANIQRRMGANRRRKGDSEKSKEKLHKRSIVVEGEGRPRKNLRLSTQEESSARARSANANHRFREDISVVNKDMEVSTLATEETEKNASAPACERVGDLCNDEEGNQSVNEESDGQEEGSENQITVSANDEDENRTYNEQEVTELKAVKKDVVNLLDDFQYEFEVQEVNNHIDSNYIEYLVVVSLDQILMPDVPPGFVESHLQHVSILLKNGYEHTRGLIVVYADPKYFKPWSKKAKISNISMRSDLKDILQVVDGIYRAIFLKILLRKKQLTSEKIIVALVQRQDGQPMSEEELFTFGIRKNAVTINTKKMSTAHNIKISNSVVRTLERQLKVKVRTKSIYWLQKKIMQIMNQTGLHKVNSLRGYAELAFTCCGRPDVQEIIDRVLSVTPQIGISHIVLSESITSDLCTLELYLLGLRKALVPSLRGPEKFDSRILQDTGKIQGTRIKAMASCKDEVYRDIGKVCRILGSIEGGESTLRVHDIVNMSVLALYEFENENGTPETKKCPYTLKDIITDNVSEWFCARTNDRVSSVIKSCEMFISGRYPQHLTKIQEARRNTQRSFKPFQVPQPKRRSYNSKKSQDPVPTSRSPSPSRYDSDEISAARRDASEIQGENSTSTAQKSTELQERLLAIRALKSCLLKENNQQIVSTPTQSVSNNRQTESKSLEANCSDLQTMSDRPQTVPISEEHIVGVANRSDTNKERASDYVYSIASRPSNVADADNDATLDSLEEITLYDEDVPENDPLGCLPAHRRNLQISQIEEGAKKSLKLGCHKQLWKNDGFKDICMGALLRALYLKTNHRASLWLTHEKLSTMHKELHDHLSSENKKRMDGISAMDSVCDLDGLRSFEEANRLRQQLDTKGWCMVESCDFIKEAMETMETVYANAPETLHGHALWEIIRNKKDDTMKELSERGKGRKQTSKVGVMEFLEEGSEAWKQRAKLDTFIGLIARALNIGMKNGDRFHLLMPSTGGRWIATDPGTGLQDVHCDLEVVLQNYGIIPECSGYFVMCSASKGFFIWVAERSHILNQCSHYDNNPIVLKKIFVPPFSFFFARGDVFHAGDKYDSIYAQESIRYHVLLTPKGDSVGNEIQYGPTDNVKWVDPVENL